MKKRAILSQRFFACILFSMIVIDFSACTHKDESDHPSVQILTDSSLGAKSGFLNSVKDDFKSKSGCELKIESTMGAAQILSYLEEPKQRERIDIVMGIDELLFERAKNYLYLSPVMTSLSANYEDFIQARKPLGFYPIDYGMLSFIYRKEDFKKGKLKVPTSLQDLLRPELKKKFIVQDPRASSPGMMFFLFADGILKTSDLRKQWLTLAPAWDASYHMFLQKDAPMVWSYLSSLAYHASKKEADEYGYVDFKEGLPLQVEGMALVNRVGNPLQSNPCNEKWMQYVLSVDAQAKLVSKQWMMPAVKNVPLPEIFKVIPKIKKVAAIPISVDRVDLLISHFGKEVQGDSY